ncbi:InlB B-repeat-containing protein [Candidatus Methanomassiliicoccus intestinalis]|uniref:InlB B-repeat-containing protein n=1 Tax=Candidatus Methanomassiliicoccus intestinalis TaxID=1406512 RepID=UPI0037DD4BC3
MNKKSKLILASAVFIAALMLLVPLSQANMPGGGVQENHISDSVVLSQDNPGNTYFVNKDATDTETGSEDSPYKTIQNAVTVATSGDTIKLLSDINSSTGKITINNKSITLDLNGKTLNTSGKNRIEVEGNGSLTITDSSGDMGKIIHAANDVDNSAIKVCGTDANNVAHLVLDKCTIISEFSKDGKKGGYGIFASNYSSIKCGSGSDTSNNNVSITAGISAISGNGLNMSSNIKICSGEYVSENAAAIYFPSTDILEVTGGEFKGKSGFDIRAGTVSISNATIIANGDKNTHKLEDAGPTSWGMGIAVFDNSLYGNAISVKITDCTFKCNTYDVYVGQHNIGANSGDFTLANGADNAPNDNINVELNGQFKYTISNSDNSKKVGAFAVKFANDGFEFADETIIGSACTLIIEGKAIIGNGIEVTNNGLLTSNGTIMGNGTLTGSADVLIDLVKGTVYDITFKLQTTEDCKAIVVSASATGDVKIEGCTINGTDHTAPDSGIYVNSKNSNVLISNVTFKDFSSTTLPINVDILPADDNAAKGKVKISECIFNNCKRSNNVLFDAYADATIGAGKNIDFDCNTTVCIWSSTGNKTFSIPEGVTFINKSILTIDNSTSLTVNGKLIYDGVYNKTENGINILDSGLIIKVGGTGSLEVKDINFKTKGLYVEGANNITVHGCTFTDISQSPLSSDTDFANGISLVKCTGNITIQKNTISGENITDSSTTSDPGHTRGILIMGCGNFNDTLIIKDNTISDIPFNAIQISKLYGSPNTEAEFGTIEISGNTISSWDVDNDNKSSELYGSGRAIRIEVGNVIADVKVINNTFDKEYGPGTYAEFGNVLKITVATGGIANVTLKNNTLNDKALDSSSTNYVMIPASSSGAKISDAEGELYGKNVSELSTDLSFTQITNSDYKFKVNGTLNYVIDYTEFWPENVAMQSGYYLPFKLTLPSKEYNSISITTHGKTDKNITLSEADKKTVAEGYINFVFFITGEFDEIKLTVDYDGSNASIGESVYIIDLSGLEFKGGVTTAPIADNAPTDSTEILKMDIDQPKDYDVEMAVGNASTILKLNAENVICHRNANNDWGYWVGVAIPVPAGAEDYTAGMGWTSSITDLTSGWDGSFVKDGITYITFYFNAGSTNMNDSKGYIAVDWDGTNSTNLPIYYTVDLSNVTLGVDVSNISTAPIEDHPEVESTIAKITPLVADSIYTVSLKSINDNIINLNISAKDLNMHRNGNHDWGYWVGVAIEVPNGVNSGVTYGFGTNASVSADNDYGTFDKIGADNKNYLTFYINAGSYAPKTYIAIDFDGAGERYEETIYCLDVSGVEFQSGDENAVKLIFNSGYASGPIDVTSYYHSGDKIKLPGSDFFTRSNYSFAGWSDGTNTYAAGSDYVISTEATLTAVWSYNGGSGGGVPITPPPVVPDEPEPIIPDSNGNVDVVIDDKKADELVHEAVSSGSDTITILDTKNVSGNVSSVTVSTTDLETISKKIENNNNIDSVSIETSNGDIIIEKEVLSSILENTKAESVSFEVEDAKNKLTEEQKKAVGDRPVYDINIKAGNENVTSFNGKTITISLPYTLKAGEDPKNIVVYYVKEDGSLDKINCEYKNGKVIFDTNHLSKYVIGYEEQDKPVTPDTPDDKKESSNNTIYYAVAAVIIILIIIALAYYFMKKKQ